MSTLDVFAQIERPTLLLNRERVRRNIARMAEKAQRSGVRLRPHFKTHQSAEIGGWFRAAGVRHATVSSVDMAAYFIAHGWDDVTIAFPCNLRQAAAINVLAAQAQLGVILGAADVARQLDAQMTNAVQAWVEIDAGLWRSGVPWNQPDEAVAVAHAIAESRHLHFAGLLTYGGRTYSGHGAHEVRTIANETVARITSVKEAVQQAGFGDVPISSGDTPSASLLEQFEGVDEVRPGNFVFYDLMQLDIGACAENDLGVALACPVVATFPERGTLVIYGGAVHLSKEVLVLPDGRPHFGRVALPNGNGWGALEKDVYMAALSQEHGTITAPASFIARVNVGDLVCVLPVHSCLTADLMKNYLTLEGERIEMFRLL